MFGLFHKKDSYSPEYFPVTTDMHSHILPGIDDGAPDVETSIKLINGLKKLQVNSSIATPHIIGDLYPNNHTTITNALNLLNEKLKEEQIDFKVRAAAEYMIDSYCMELLESKEPLLAIKDNIILTEFPFTIYPQHLEEIVFNIFTEGYLPILAHPERYNFVRKNYKLFHRWIDLGFLLQVNALSLTGYYGKEAAAAARYLFKNKLVSFIGTDMHHDRHLRLLSEGNNRKILQEFMDYQSWNDNLF
jgi:tyrosine-protein phosphatase YwqE